MMTSCNKRSAKEKEVQEPTSSDAIGKWPGKQIVLSSTPEMVKSTAVVKWSSSRQVVQFSKLSINTNLNDAPENWLRSRSYGEQYLRELPWRRRHFECTSFAMASFHPDLTGEVDIVSEGENIKTLAKMAFMEQSEVSMMVHRVNKTLLLDKFDVHKHLLRQESENWKWLQEFFKQYVMKDEDDMRSVPCQITSQASLQGQLMYSKFLYHSLADQDVLPLSTSPGDQLEHLSHVVSPSPLTENFPANQKPPSQSASQVPLERGQFHRQTLWTFENLRMLIGTDLPVFSVGDHPCVSVRLRDMSQPINIVTGLDYWLDNLMCNVPELAMCYHDAGFVQKYELYKTEDIPKLDSCQFDPQTVKDVASNILAFLRSNTTKEGHTYWLFKSKRWNVLKLYDLTSLCGTAVPDTGIGATPFTIPVAMLLCRVARNLQLGPKPRCVPKIKALLETGLKLLDETKHAEVVTSSLYLLSDIYVPDSCLEDVWNEADDTSSEESSEDEFSERGEDVDRTMTGDGAAGDNQVADGNQDRLVAKKAGSVCSDNETQISVRDLINLSEDTWLNKKVDRLEGVHGTAEERCLYGLHCVHRALVCLDRDSKSRSVKPQDGFCDVLEDQPCCDPDVAIPLHYECLGEPADYAQPAAVVEKVLAKRGADLGVGLGTGASWHDSSRALLLRKACIANQLLAVEFLSSKQCGRSLRRIRYAVVCFESMSTITLGCKQTVDCLLLMKLLLVTAEVRHFMGVHGAFDVFQRGYDDMSEEDAFILDQAQSVVPKPEMSWVFKWTTDRHENFLLSMQCLTELHTLARQQPQTATVQDLTRDVTKKMSVVNNELGKVCLAEAETLLSNGCVQFTEMEEVWQQGVDYFERGVVGAQKVKDSMNAALIGLNVIKLYKIAGHCYGSADPPEMTKVTQFFLQALDRYKEVLTGREWFSQPLRNNIMWEFCSTYLQLAVKLRRHPPCDRERDKAYRETSRLYRQARKCCQDIRADAGTDMWRDCRDMLALIDYYHGDLLTASYTEQKLLTNTGSANRLFSEADGFLRKAGEQFLRCERPYRYLQVQCKRIIFHATHYLGGADRQANPYPVLALLMECRVAVAEVAACPLPQPGEMVDPDFRNAGCLLQHLMDATLVTLKHLLYSSKQSKNTTEQENVKQFYKRSLELQKLMKPCEESPRDTDVDGIGEHMAAFSRVIDSVHGFYGEAQRGGWKDR